MDEIRHITASTGHVRRSPRSEVGDDAIRVCTPLIRDGKHLIPGMAGYAVESQTIGPAYQFRVYFGDVLVISGTLFGRALTITLHGGAELLDGCEWLGDFERCLAWAWIENHRGN